MREVEMLIVYCNDEVKAAYGKEFSEPVIKQFRDFDVIDEVFSDNGCNIEQHGGNFRLAWKTILIPES